MIIIVFLIGVYEAVRPLDTNRLEFLADDTYTANLAVVKFLARGSYVVDGSEIVLNEEKGPYSDIPGGYPGKIQLVFRREIAGFHSCGGPVSRKFDLQSQWIKQP